MLKYVLVNQLLQKRLQINYLYTDFLSVNTDHPNIETLAQPSICLLNNGRQEVFVKSFVFLFLKCADITHVTFNVASEGLSVT